MKTPPAILIDGNYLCWASHFQLRHLSVQEQGSRTPTGVLYGFLRMILKLSQQFKSNDFYFCFDGPDGFRKQDFPAYKANRKKDLEQTKEVHQQIELLRTEVLPAIGFRNVWCQRGIEADDLIAMALKYLPKNRRVLIVSGDEDLYQLLSSHVAVYHPAKDLLFTLGMFRKAYGVEPTQWPRLKAMAGCSSDNIPGIPGIGEKKALAILKGESSIPENKGREWNEIVRKFLRLTKLPYPKTQALEITKNELDYVSLIKLCEKYSFDSILVHDSADWQRIIDGDFSTTKERIQNNLKRKQKGLLK